MILKKLTKITEKNKSVVTFVFISVILSLSLIIIKNIYNKIYKTKLNEHFDNDIKDTFKYSLNNIGNSKIIDNSPSIKYFDGEVKGFIGSPIKYTLKINNKRHYLYRYPDFRNEIKRHSKDYFNKYLSYFKQNHLNKTDNFILDFNGWHGVFDNKVRLWINLKKKYNREIANKFMCKSYILPGDKELFIKDYNNKNNNTNNNKNNTNNKYILKNSYGGARSALKITKSYDEILEHFNDLSVDSEKCVDAVEHSKRKYNIVQVFNEPEFLIKGRKVGLRLFLVIIIKDGVLKGYIYKDGYTYYSTNTYNITNTDIDSNVVGLPWYTTDFIEKYNLPDTFLDFKKYINNDLKINNFEKKLKEYVNMIISSNLNDINSFREYKNINTYGIYAMDIEFDKNMNPSIYEANFYFSRIAKLTHNRFVIFKKILTSMYNDIYVKMGYSENSNINGFYAAYP